MQLSALDDHLEAPRGLGRLAEAPHTGAAGGAACGDLIRVSVAVEGDRVAEVGFDASGCAAARAAGSAAVELSSGRPLLEVAATTPAMISEALGGLSPQRMHAAALAADALHRALGAAARAGAARLAPDARRTLVAMSGGVDSAAAAALAVERGDDVIAVTLELWADPAGDGTKSCCSPQAVTAARALAHEMGLPHLTLDVRPRFEREVVADFIREYAGGRTPNPCIRCNGQVRFDVMLALADQLGAARLATGHYARVTRDSEGHLLRRARSDAKDQSYMLARLTASELERVWFPLGELDKPAVREAAREWRLPVADKAESQDLCFLAGLGARAFLERHGGLGDEPGEIVDREGRVVGSHNGQHRFTVGQRRGIGVAGKSALFVLAKDPSARRVTVGPREALARTRIELEQAVLHRDAHAVESVKTRYRSRPLRCRVEGDPPRGRHDRVTIVLDEPCQAVAPGQTACLMAGESVIGCGVIADG